MPPQNWGAVLKLLYVYPQHHSSWTDYVPPYLQVKAGGRVRVFEDNAIHVGCGYKVDVESAVDRIHDILENYDEYRARVEEWRWKVLFNEYRWDRVILKLAGVASGNTS